MRARVPDKVSTFTAPYPLHPSIEWTAATMDRDAMAAEEEEQRQERLHFANVLKAFDDYLPYCLSANDARRRSYFSLPRAHQSLLADLGQPLPLPQLDESGTSKQQSQSRGFRSRLEEIDDRIRRNADLLTLIADESRGFLGPLEEDQDAEEPQHNNSNASSSNSSSSNGVAVSSSSKSGRKRRKISGHEIDKIQSTLKQFVRDWSREGDAERSAVYAPLMEAVESRYGRIPFQDRGHVRILVPGAGLGRLAFEYAAQGYSCQGNEFSFYMLLASHYILNKSSQIHQHTIYPFVHSSSNWRQADDMLARSAYRTYCHPRCRTRVNSVWSPASFARCTPSRKRRKHGMWLRRASSSIRPRM